MYENKRNVDKMTAKESDIFGNLTRILHIKNKLNPFLRDIAEEVMRKPLGASAKKNGAGKCGWPAGIASCALGKPASA